MVAAVKLTQMTAFKGAFFSDRVNRKRQLRALFERGMSILNKRVKDI